FYAIPSLNIRATPRLHLSVVGPAYDVLVHLGHQVSPSRPGFSDRASWIESSDRGAEAIVIGADHHLQACVLPVPTRGRVPSVHVRLGRCPYLVTRMEE